MARILITSGPTRQYLDPVRYLTNGSSGRMGSALAQAALDAGHEVVIVSGPVAIEYPTEAEVHSVITTERDASGGPGSVCPLRWTDRSRRPVRLSSGPCPAAEDFENGRAP